MNPQYFKSIDLPGIDKIKHEVLSVLSVVEDGMTINKDFNLRYFSTEFFESCPALINAIELICPFSDVRFIGAITTDVRSSTNYIHSDISAERLSSPVTDQTLPDPPWALNFPITNCIDTYTVWYKLKPGRTAIRKYHPQNQFPFFIYNSADVEEVDRLYMNGRAAFFNTHEIHGVVNPTDQRRMVISVRFNKNLADLGLI